MKSRSLIVAVVLLSGLFTAHGVERDIVKIWKNPYLLLKEIRSQIENHNRNQEEDKALAGNIKTLAYEISVELNAAESPDWGTPSLERKAVIHKWADILAPETQKLVDLAFGEGFGKSRSSFQARSLLDYAPSSSVFADQVRKYVHQSPWVALAAADLLYEHRLLSDADKAALREWRPDADQGADIERWALGVSSVGMLDGLEVAKRDLAIDPQGETPEEIIRQYRGSLEIASLLGPNALGLLPDIEALIANPKIISSGFLQHFEHARDVVSGRQPRQGRYAVNGSGPVGASPLPRSSVPTSAATTAQTTPVLQATSPVQQPKAAATSTPVADAQFSSSYPILPVAIVGVVIMGIFLFILRRKST